MKNFTSNYHRNVNLFTIAIGFLVLFGLSACQETEMVTDDNAPKGEMQIVKFGASGMYKNYKNFGTGVSDVPVHEHLNYLYYFAFDGSGKKVKSLAQVKKTTPDFGLVIDTTYTGEQRYRVFIGSEKPLKLTINKYADSKFFYPKDANNDVFIFRSEEPSFYYTGYNEIVLTRLIGKLTFLVRDTLPKNAASIEVIRRNAPSNFFFKDGTKSENDVTYSLKLKPGKNPVVAPPLTVYALPDPENVYLGVSVFNKEGDLLIYKEVFGNYAIKPNKELVVSGFLFKSRPEFNVLMDTKWGETDSLDFFGY